MVIQLLQHWYAQLRKFKVACQRDSSASLYQVFQSLLSDPALLIYSIDLALADMSNGENMLLGVH